MRVPLTAVLAALLLALSAALPVAAQDASGGDCAGDGASPALAVISVLPSADSDEGKHQTHSRNPYIVFEFPCAAAAELTAVALDGADVLEQAVQASARKYALAAYRLELGWHSVVYSAQDDAGNVVEGVSFLFQVLERPPYRVPLYPGWNLISFHFYPWDHSIENVIGPDKKADMVMAYQYGEWKTAIRGDRGWEGDLHAIWPGYGYWVRTTAVEVLQTVLAEYNPSAFYVLTPVVRGWNLLGVMDIQLHPSPAYREADDQYNFPWRVGYGFNTRLNRWDEPLRPGAEPPARLEHGRGYWVWSEAEGLLTPY